MDSKSHFTLPVLYSVLSFIVPKNVLVMIRHIKGTLSTYAREPSPKVSMAIHIHFNPNSDRHKPKDYQSFSFIHAVFDKLLTIFCLNETFDDRDINSNGFFFIYPVAKPNYNIIFNDLYFQAHENLYLFGDVFQQLLLYTEI